MPLPLSNTLQGAWTKYDRAVKDFAALNDDARRFLDTEPYGVDIEFEKKTGSYIAHSSIREEPPPGLGVLVGSTAHQCLSALNHVVWALAVRKLGDKSAGAKRKGIEFPICETASEFKKRPTIAKRYVSKQAITVLERLQPYAGPMPPGGVRQHYLFLIKDLADADKHRVLAAGYGRVDLNGLWSGESLAWDPLRSNTNHRATPQTAHHRHAGPHAEKRHTTRANPIRGREHGRECARESPTFRTHSLCGGQVERDHSRSAGRLHRTNQLVLDALGRSVPEGNLAARRSVA